MAADRRATAVVEDVVEAFTGEVLVHATCDRLLRERCARVWCDASGTLTVPADLNNAVLFNSAQHDPRWLHITCKRCLRAFLAAKTFRSGARISRNAKAQCRARLAELEKE